MDHRMKKLLALVLCCAVLVGAVGVTALALNADKGEGNKSPESTVTGSSDGEEKIQKDETVYVLVGADGSVKKIIVSDWIKNTLGSASLKDKTELSDVVNVKGDESYTVDGDNMKVWDAQGNDIYYQGNIEKELPVGLRVSYTLDGSQISAEDLAGKSGKVTIRFDYQNNQYAMTEIDGKREKIYVPFAMLTGMMLDNGVFSNVEVTNGKLINDGDRTIVAGIAFPGLQSDLNISEDKLSIPSYVEITADVKNFEMANTVTLATNEIFNKLDTGKMDSVDGLTDQLDELSDGMAQLLDGSSKLYDGLCTLLDKSGELIRGIDKLAEGAAKLKAGSGDLDKGAADLSDGAKALAAGLGKLDANSGALNAGAKQVFETLLDTANEQIAAAGLTVPTLTIDDYAKVLDETVASLQEEKVRKQAEQVARKTVTAKVNEQKDVIVAQVTAGVRKTVEETVVKEAGDQIWAQVLSTQGMTKAQYDAAVKAGQISVETQKAVEAAVDEQIQKIVDVQMQGEKAQKAIADNTEKTIGGLIEQNMQSESVQNSIAAAVEKAKAGAATLQALKGQLDDYNTFYTGIGEYTQGVAEAKDGADRLDAGSAALKNGTATLYAGMDELYNGILTLKNGAPALVDGVTALRDGAMQLSDGLKEFNEKGVQKIVDIAEGDLAGVVTRAKATVDVSKAYTSFAGAADEMDGQVKFIYRTDAIKTK